MNNNAWRNPGSPAPMGACPKCDYWWGKDMVIMDECGRCSGTGVDLPLPTSDMIK